ncbi:MAG: small acid-soluble spore protein Tlp [Bacillota bacterium]|nr:small acid-soluble spore protein Tlp [Bacillota bacterium]
MKHNPDNRSDNVEKIQEHIDDTVKNIRLADEMIEKTSDRNAKRDLQDKNERRERALEGMRHEIKDEADYQEKRK